VALVVLALVLVALAVAPPPPVPPDPELVVLPVPVVGDSDPPQAASKHTVAIVEIIISFMGASSRYSACGRTRSLVGRGASPTTIDAGRPPSLVAALLAADENGYARRPFGLVFQGYFAGCAPLKVVATTSRRLDASAWESGISTCARRPAPG
jgi:hypothetical protein